MLTHSSLVTDISYLRVPMLSVDPAAMNTTFPTATGNNLEEIGKEHHLLAGVNSTKLNNQPTHKDRRAQSI